MAWNIPEGLSITATTKIKDTDDRIASIVEDMENYVNGTDDYVGVGLTDSFVTKDTAQTITGDKVFSGSLTGSLTGNADTASTATTLTGLTASVSELNTLEGSAVTSSELNTLVGITATTIELNYTGSLTGNIQAQLNGKQAVGSYVTTTSTQSLHSSDALRISNDVISLYKGSGASDSVTLPRASSSVYGTAKIWLSGSTLNIYT
jgi:hypothetical protein